jgi:hypothetical protein
MFGAEGREERLILAAPLSWWSSVSLPSGIPDVLNALEGIEKLRAIDPGGGVGKGDAVWGALGGVCLDLKWSWTLGAKEAEFGTNGAEWATKLENVVFFDELTGGRGSSWSSFILGEEMGGGVVLGETLTWTAGWCEELCLCGTETTSMFSVDLGLEAIGPEKDPLFTFLSGVFES